MPTRLQLTAILLLSAAIWTALLAFEGVHTDALFTTLATVVSCMVVIFLLWDLFLWKVPVLHAVLASTSHIGGTWKGIIESNHEKDGKPVDPIEAYLVIRQTFFYTSVRLLTRESSSEPLAHSIRKAADGEETLVGVYQNTPKKLLREGSPIHFGAVLLQVLREDKRARLEGEYWTERRTWGQLRFSQRISRRCADFDAAAAAKWA